VKSSGTPWNRLILDLNRAAVGGRVSRKLRRVVGSLKAVFPAFCTQERKGPIPLPRHKTSYLAPVAVAGGNNSTRTGPIRPESGDPR
jgi:hypothetical protein